MRVICIQDVMSSSPDAGEPKIKAGNPYTVFEDVGEYYELYEHPGRLYKQRLFAPTSLIDETTFERDYNKELQPK